MPVQTKRPPVLDEAINRRIKELLRGHKPFTTADVLTPDILSLTVKCMKDNPDLAPERPQNPDGKMTANEYANLVILALLKRMENRGKWFRRWDSVKEIWERDTRSSIILYPSNDRDRYHLKPHEVFIRGSIVYGANKDDLKRAQQVTPIRYTPPTTPAEVVATDPFDPQFAIIGNLPVPAENMKFDGSDILMPEPSPEGEALATIDNAVRRIEHALDIVKSARRDIVSALRVMDRQV